MKLKSKLIFGLSSVIVAIVPTIAASCDNSAKQLAEAKKQLENKNTELTQLLQSANDVEAYKAVINSKITANNELINKQDIIKEKVDKSIEDTSAFITNMTNLIQARSTLLALTPERFKDTYLKELQVVLQTQYKDRIYPQLLTKEMVQPATFETSDQYNKVTLKSITVANLKDVINSNTASEQDKNAANDLIKEGKGKVTVTFVASQIQYPEVNKEFSEEYIVDGMLTEAKIKEIFTNVLKDIQVSNTLAQADKNTVFIEKETDSDYTSNAAKYLNGEYKADVLEKYLSLKTNNDLVKATYVIWDWDVLKGTASILPYVYPAGLSDSDYVMYKGINELNINLNDETQAAKVKEEDLIKLSNLPKIKIAPAAYRTLFATDHVLGFDTEKILQATKKTALNEVTGKELTKEIMQEALKVTAEKLPTKSGDYELAINDEWFKEINPTVQSVTIKRNPVMPENSNVLEVKVQLSMPTLKEGEIVNWLLLKSAIGATVPQEQQTGIITLMFSGFKFDASESTPIEKPKPTAESGALDEFMKTIAPKLNVEVELSAEDIQNIEETLLPGGKAYGKYSPQVEIKSNVVESNIPKNSAVESVRIASFADLFKDHKKYRLVPANNPIFKNSFSKFVKVQYDKENKIITGSFYLGENQGTSKKPKNVLSANTYKFSIKLIEEQLEPHVTTNMEPEPVSSTEN
ncbi:variable surface lipoprotein [Mycoplasmopsis verecunda]|uniref:Lipoprotein associated domain-containing protein n=1 Tax=Mycoplasmopsis verecunda TaxID=171291 RepID=A0A1T4LRB7_9BACT|nr:variable surface lipoprotein [Mycoplasmopsis verecunda]WPB54585.1 variable surface lipoprotein [Mycoplasmopsis verecunda]SJZ57280.1 hypothetical protein SAMN02745154_00523 [Mycoplasmopsis verecunda]